MLYSSSIPDSNPQDANRPNIVIPVEAYKKVVYPGTFYNDKWHGRIEGHVYRKEEGKYVFAIDENHQIAFQPQLKTNSYTGETLPFNLEEFAKKSDFKDCELLDFVWEESVSESREKNIKKIIGSEGRVLAFENDLGYTFLLKPQKKYLLKKNTSDDYIYSVAKGYINNYLANYNNNYNIFASPNDIAKVYDRPMDQITEDLVPLTWHPESRILDGADFSYILGPDYNVESVLVQVPMANDSSANRYVKINEGQPFPISYTETSNVLTLNFSNGDYCKFSKLKDYELFEGVYHFPFGVLKASLNSVGEIDKSIDCTGVVSSGSGYTGSTYNYNGFTADLIQLSIKLDPSKGSDYINNIVKFDDSDQLQKWLYSKANNYWTLTSTGEKATWSDGILLTESLKEKRRQDEIARNEEIKKSVIANYKAKYGASTIENVMKGRITVGMPWVLVSEAFPYTNWNATKYSKSFKVVNNLPTIDISSKKITKQLYGMGNLVYVTVCNGKVTNVTYTNHR